MLQQKLQQRKKQGNLRQLQIRPPLIDFASNDYLGLARSALLYDRVKQEAEKDLSPLNGFGSTGSRLLTGNTAYAEQLESFIAQFHGFEAGTLFNCGYMANIGLLSSIGTSQDIFFFDSAIHASTRDGIRLSKATAYPFRHNDLDHLEKRLQNYLKNGNRFICVESIYSMDGSLAPLKELCELAHKYQAYLIVDEAHAVGMYGKNGRGVVAEHQLSSKVFAQITTFGKALGVHGAIVLGSHDLKQILINFATSYLYTTALPFYALAAIQSSYQLFPRMISERAHLQQLIQIFRTSIPFASSTHIQSLPIPGNENVKRHSELLFKQGFDVRPIMSPTVRRGHEMLRVCLHVFNQEDHLNQLLRAISNA